MNWDQIEGNWKKLGGKIKEQWGKLTDDQLTVINGKRDQLAGQLQKAYGIDKEEAETQIKNWTERVEKERWVNEGGSAQQYRKDHPQM